MAIAPGSIQVVVGAGFPITVETQKITGLNPPWLADWAGLVQLFVEWNFLVKPAPTCHPPNELINRIID